MNMTIARRIYWWLSLAGLAVVWGGMWRKHQRHSRHFAMCKCMPNCIPCAVDALREKEHFKEEI